MYSRWPGRTQSLNIAGLPDLKRNAGNSVTLPVARRVQRVKPSPTLAVTARAARLREQGKDVIGLGAGEPDFDTPAHIAQAGVAAIQGGFTRYTNVEGIDELKDAIIAKFERDNALTYERSQILVSAGAKQTLYNLAMAVIDPGDEAIIPAPYWVSYPDMVLWPTDCRSCHLPGWHRGTRSRRASWPRPSPRRHGCCCSIAPAIPPAPPTRAPSCADSGKCCSSIRAFSSAPMTCTRRSTGSRSRSAAS